MNRFINVEPRRNLVIVSHFNIYKLNTAKYHASITIKRYTRFSIIFSSPYYFNTNRTKTNKHTHKHRSNLNYEDLMHSSVR